MKIGDLNLTGYAALAPMAGVADAAFRELCIGYGAAFSVTEMISAKALTMGDRKSRELMRIGDAERPCGVQIFGGDPGTMAYGAALTAEARPDFIDINMGCPAPKIVKNGAGSTLLKDPARAEAIVRAVKSVVTVPVGVKFRIGWDRDHINCAEFAKRLEAGGADFLTVHGRTRDQMYAPPVDLDAIARVRQSVSVPVIANGDIFSPEDAKNAYARTGCDLVMVGRGSMGRPWLFYQIDRSLSAGEAPAQPSPEERMRVMLAHARRICELKGERVGINEVRKHALWYTKGLRGAARLRGEFSRLESLAALDALARRVIEENG